MNSALQTTTARWWGCRYPGCTHRQWVDGHHFRHWAEGGETKLDNLVLMCRFHHRLVHEDGFELCRDGHGDIRFRRPDGRAVPTAGAPRNIFGRAYSPDWRRIMLCPLDHIPSAWTAKPCLPQQ